MTLCQWCVDDAQVDTQADQCVCHEYEHRAAATLHRVWCTLPFSGADQVS